MSVENVLKTIKDEDVVFVDVRFTDTKGKEQHVTVPAREVNEEFF
jgi:glutamine synthetase